MIKQKQSKDSGNVLSYTKIDLLTGMLDIDFYYKDSLLETATVTNIDVVVNGNVCSALNISYVIGNSKIDQK